MVGFFNYSVIISIFISVLHATVLIKKTKVERVLLSEEQKILIHIIRVLALTLISSVVILKIIEWSEKYSINDVKKEELPETLLSLFLAGFLIAYLLYILVVVITPLISKERNFYINHKVYGKLYVIKSLNKEQIILSKSTTIDEVGKGIIVFDKKDLFSHFIYSEILNKSSN